MKTFLLALSSVLMFTSAANAVSATTGKQAITNYLKENFTKPVSYSGMTKDGAMHLYTYQFEDGLLLMGGEVESGGLVATLIGEELVTDEGLILPVARKGQVVQVTEPSQCEVTKGEVECKLTYEIRSADTLWKFKTHYQLSPSRRKQTSSSELYGMQEGRFVLQYEGTDSYEVSADEL